MIVHAYARGKFGEHKRSEWLEAIIVSNSSFLSALKTSQVHYNSMVHSKKTCVDCVITLPVEVHSKTRAETHERKIMVGQIARATSVHD